MGAGLLGAGAFAYAGWSALSDKSKPGEEGDRFREEQPSGFDDGSIIDGEDGSPQDGPDIAADVERSEEEEEKSQSIQEFENQGGSEHFLGDTDNDNNSNATEKVEEEQQEQEGQEEQEEQEEEQPPVIVDSRDVLGVIEEVFKQPTEQVLGSVGNGGLEGTPSDTPLTSEPPSEAISQASTALSGLSTDLLQVLGVSSMDITPSGLLSKASPSDWESFSARHTQAVADAETLARLLKQIGHNVENQLQRAHEEVMEARGDAEAARLEIAKQSDGFKKALAEALAQAEKAYETKLQMQLQALKVSNSEAMVRERAERQEMLDGLRLKVNALHAALSQRSGIAKESSKAHALAQGSFALRTALRDGSFTRAEEALQRIMASSDDPLVLLATKSLHPILESTKSLPTRLQLVQELRKDLKRVARELVVFPTGKIPGFLSIGVAKTAALLKLDETNGFGPADSVSGGSGGIDSALSKVEGDMIAGRLVLAARKMEEATNGTAASWAVKDWVSRVKARAAAEQVAAVVEASAIASTMEWVA